MTERKRFILDWRWLVIIPFIALAFVLAFHVNKNGSGNSSTKITDFITIDNSDTKIKWERYQTTDIELTEAITISQSGTYHLTGSLEDANIVVNAGVSEVRLILDNVHIDNNSGPAILCYNAENLVIELVGENTLSDGENYLASYDEDIRGVIYSKADLAFGGTGTLNIYANHQDGIVGKDDVKFNNGNYNIIAESDAIVGKDSVYIVDGEYKLEAINNGIKSTNTSDYGKGFILVDNGKFSIETSAKGLKATNSILINDGSINIDSYDDAIHAENYVGVVAGEVMIQAGDDAIHANKEVIIDGGLINITKSYEGIEARVVNINNGNISIFATDDGVNAGNSDEETPIHNSPEKTDENCKIVFNGGNTYINSAGDGVDSNGYVYINDGILTIDGPTVDDNGALDSGLGFTTSGGKVLAIGSSGMAGNLGQNSDIFSISVYFDEIQSPDTNIEIKNAEGDVVLSHTSAKEFDHLAASTTEFVLGDTYTIYLNDKEYQTFRIAEILTTLGNNNNLDRKPPKV